MEGTLGGRGLFLAKTRIPQKPIRGACHMAFEYEVMKNSDEIFLRNQRDSGTGTHETYETNGTYGSGTCD